ncbi:MAG: nucleotidyltransferase domain-containing protein [Chloroflexi bacterium]|nr:nucleotidyltransferase domain-containing protein [Chloroflexota bacterium]
MTILQKAPSRSRSRARPTPRQRFARLRQNERAALTEFVARLQAELGNRVQQVILYGSRARNEGDAESDADVLVVLDTVDRTADDTIVEAAFQVTMKYDSVVLSPVAWSLARYEQNRTDRLLFFRNLEQDGIELWNAPEKSPMFATN